MATFRRPERLAAAIPALIEQGKQLSSPARILLVDNDPEQSAQDAVRPWLGPTVDYVWEPEPGIAAARNRAIDESAESDLLVFIDDDEIPQPGWLAALVQAWREWGCAAVAGPV